MKERIMSVATGLVRLMCAALIVGTISACGGSGSEPTPTPPTPPIPPTPGGGTTTETGIKVKIKDGTTLAVRLNAGSAKIKDEALPVGTTKTLTVTKGEIITITGSPEQIIIGNGQIEYIAIAEDATSVAASLKTLGFSATEESKGYLESINLVGATNLETLSLRDYGSSFTKLDLSKQSKLKVLTLGSSSRTGAQRSLAEVVWPTTNVIEDLTLRETGIKTNIPFGSFAQLKNLTIYGSAAGALNQDVTFDGHSSIEKVDIRLMHHSKNFTLKNCSKLNTVLFTGNRGDADAMSGDVTITITGCKALDGANVTLTSMRSSEPASAHITEINISDNNLATIAAPSGLPLLFSGARVKKVNISGNRLSDATITAIIAALPQGDGSQVFVGAKASGEGNTFTETHKAALAAKKWTVQ